MGALILMLLIAVNADLAAGDVILVCLGWWLVSRNRK